MFPLSKYELQSIFKKSFNAALKALELKGYIKKVVTCPAKFAKHATSDCGHLSTEAFEAAAY
uniref:Uncharacterized protein n=1 Tax=Helianthus annuus TaxID=4232 RepID=A0A251THZ0_HELAN